MSERGADADEVEVLWRRSEGTEIRAEIGERIVRDRVLRFRIRSEKPSNGWDDSLPIYGGLNGREAFWSC